MMIYSTYTMTRAHRYAGMPYEAERRGMRCDWITTLCGREIEYWSVFALADRAKPPIFYTQRPMCRRCEN